MAGYDLIALWETHCHYEFEAHDVCDDGVETAVRRSHCLV
jgi:hypothetical protein